MDNSVECPKKERFLCGGNENRAVWFKLLFWYFLGVKENTKNVGNINRITGKVSGWASLKRRGYPTYNSLKRTDLLWVITQLVVVIS
jgi:hypothetical protein